MSELQQFVGDRTIEKLDILASYLDACLTENSKKSIKNGTLTEQEEKHD